MPRKLVQTGDSRPGGRSERIRGRNAFPFAVVEKLFELIPARAGPGFHRRH